MICRNDRSIPSPAPDRSSDDSLLFTVCLVPTSPSHQQRYPQIPGGGLKTREVFVTFSATTNTNSLVCRATVRIKRNRFTATIIVLLQTVAIVRALLCSVVRDIVGRQFLRRTCGGGGEIPNRKTTQHHQQSHSQRFGSQAMVLLVLTTANIFIDLQHVR